MTGRSSTDQHRWEASDDDAAVGRLIQLSGGRHASDEDCRRAFDNHVGRARANADIQDTGGGHASDEHGGTADADGAADVRLRPVEERTNVKIRKSSGWKTHISHPPG